MYFLETFCDTPHINFGLCSYTGCIFVYTFNGPCDYIGFQTGVYICVYTFNGLCDYIGFQTGVYILDYSFGGYIGCITDVYDHEYTTQSGPVWSCARRRKTPAWGNRA